MTHFLKLLSALVAIATPLLAQPAPHPISQTIRDQGLAAAQAKLDAISAPSVEERFLLGGVRFLRAIETALHTRYRYNIGQSQDSGFPVLRIPMPQNPSPEPFEPHLVSTIFGQLLVDMASVRADLANLQTESFDVTISLSDVWLDIDGDGLRGSEGSGENLTDLIRSPRPRPGTPEPEAPVNPERLVRFDSADANWLAAYASLLSASSELLLAFDPTEAIAGAMADGEALKPFLIDPQADNGEMMRDPDKARKLQSALPSMQFRGILDSIAVVLDSLDQMPDAARLEAARGHMFDMIASNRMFWQQVALETDDDLEWIPGDGQASALGLVVPEGSGAAWLSVLADVEKVLRGELLVPHILAAPLGGIDLDAFIRDPAPIDLFDWIHGRGALRYLRTGTAVGSENWRAFTQLVGRRDAMLFAVWFN